MRAGVTSKISLPQKCFVTQISEQLILNKQEMLLIVPIKFCMSNCIFHRTLCPPLEYWSGTIFLSVGLQIGWDELRLWANGYWNWVIFHYAREEVKGGRHLRNDQSGQCWSDVINSAQSALSTQLCLHRTTPKKTFLSTLRHKDMNYWTGFRC